MNVSNLIELLTGASLFLFGMALMGEGLKQVAGNKLEVILYKLTGTPLKGLLFGTGITTVIQSSSATSVMVVGFVNSNIMTVRQAIPIVLGAIFGTSITGWIICLSGIGVGSGWLMLFSTSMFTCLAALVGIYLRMFSKDRFRNHVGNVFLGFAVLMFGMSVMSGAVTPLKDNKQFISILTELSNPFLGILVGIVFTSILQSASAAVGILQALAMTGTVQFDMALPLIMGISIGASVPVLLSAIGATTNGKRTALAYLTSNTLGVILSATIFYGFNTILNFSFIKETMTMVTVAALNSIYRLGVVAVLFPFFRQLEFISNRLIHSGSKNIDDDLPILPLEERFINYPSLAIEQCHDAINDMATKAKENLFLSFELLRSYSQEKYERIQLIENIIDRYEDKLGTYLLKITSKELNDKQNESIGKFLHTITDFERISDHAVNLAEAGNEIHEKEVVFSDDAKNELYTVGNAVADIVTMAFDAFLNNDLQLAEKVEPLEELIDNLCGEMKLHHVQRLKDGVCSLNSGFVFNDILNNYERIADHCSNIAVAMIALESDSFDTHEYLDSVKRLKSETYAKYFEAYSKKYVIEN
ncbi:MAG TPA: Na/Pi cotransporter family protein [Clostridiaceae bacterium]|nr:Na/Pi cotransporter family protein [Clostridiaceae bacterium]